MRAVDADWPAVGSRIQHSIRVWPFVVNDVSDVQECHPLEELVLLAGSARDATAGGLSYCCREAPGRVVLTNSCRTSVVSRVRIGTWGAQGDVARSAE